MTGRGRPSRSGSDPYRQDNTNWSFPSNNLQRSRDTRSLSMDGNINPSNSLSAYYQHHHPHYSRQQYIGNSSYEFNPTTIETKLSPQSATIYDHPYVYSSNPTNTSLSFSYHSTSPKPEMFEQKPSPSKSNVRQNVKTKSMTNDYDWIA